MRKNKNLLLKPFLKWAGGKRQLLSEIRKYYPKKYKTYYEPFVGAGAVFMDLQPNELVINDYNGELINAYEVIKNDVEALIEKLKIHDENNTKEYFYELRELDRGLHFENMTNVERAARLIYLNKTCFNGLFRVNSNGQFNVPYGNYKNPNIVNELTLRANNVFFNKTNIRIVNGDFEVICRDAVKGDFFYFDPPYADVNDDKASFVGYTLNGFNVLEQERLRDLFVELDKKGCFVMLSNSSVPIIHELYKDYEDTTVILNANRSINSNASGRGKVEEVLVMNYKIE